MIRIASHGFRVIDQPYNGRLSTGFHFTASPSHTDGLFPPSECLIMCYILLRKPVAVSMTEADAKENEQQFCFCADEECAEVFRRYNRNRSTAADQTKKELSDEFFTNDWRDILPFAVALTEGSFDHRQSDEKDKQHVVGVSGLFSSFAQYDRTITVIK